MTRETALAALVGLIFGCYLSTLYSFHRLEALVSKQHQEEMDMMNVSMESIWPHIVDCGIGRFR